MSGKPDFCSLTGKKCDREACVENKRCTGLDLANQLKNVEDPFTRMLELAQRSQGYSSEQIAGIERALTPLIIVVDSWIDDQIKKIGKNIKGT